MEGVRRDYEKESYIYDTLIKMGKFGAKINWGLGSILTWKSSGICKTFGTTSLHLTLVSGSQERWLWASCLHEDCRNRRHRRSLASRRRLFGRHRIQPSCEHGFPSWTHTLVFSVNHPLFHAISYTRVFIQYCYQPSYCKNWIKLYSYFTKTASSAGL